ncbi:MAG TPA: hypothetical protein DCM14_00830 [Clostridiales bacterium UBA8153]|nr:hypothetical protein [Clostridiales bacterium UBA8153]
MAALTGHAHRRTAGVRLPKSPAGNWLGNARTDQPGVLGPAFFSRQAKTPGGVRCSLPWQNGQLPPARWCGVRRIG